MHRTCIWYWYDRTRKSRVRLHCTTQHHDGHGPTKYLPPTRSGLCGVQSIRNTCIFNSIQKSVYSALHFSIHSGCHTMDALAGDDCWGANQLARCGQPETFLLEPESSLGPRALNLESVYVHLRTSINLYTSPCHLIFNLINTVTRTEYEHFSWYSPICIPSGPCGIIFRAGSRFLLFFFLKRDPALKHPATLSLKYNSS